MLYGPTSSGFPRTRPIASTAPRFSFAPPPPPSPPSPIAPSEAFVPSEPFVPVAHSLSTDFSAEEPVREVRIRAKSPSPPPLPPVTPLPPPPIPKAAQKAAPPPVPNAEPATMAAPAHHSIAAQLRWPHRRSRSQRPQSPCAPKARPPRHRASVSAQPRRHRVSVSVHRRRERVTSSHRVACRHRCRARVPHAEAMRPRASRPRISARYRASSTSFRRPSIRSSTIARAVRRSTLATHARAFDRASAFRLLLVRFDETGSSTDPRSRRPRFVD